MLDDEMTIKFLSCILSSIEPTMGATAKEELRAQGAAQRFRTAAGARDFQACVQFFDDMWRAHFRPAAGSL